MATVICDYLNQVVYLSATHRYTDSAMIRSGFVSYNSKCLDEGDIFAGCVECGFTNAKIKSCTDKTAVSTDIIKCSNYYNKEFMGIKRDVGYKHSLDDLISASFFYLCNGDLAMANAAISAFMSIRNVIIEDTLPSLTYTKPSGVKPYEL